MWISEDFKDNYYTYNRKLKLEEYDDDGNLIDVIEFSQADLWEFYMLKNNGYSDFRLGRKKDREYFKGEKLELAKGMLNILDKRYFNNDTIRDIENIFEIYTLEEVKFALDFKNYSYGEVNYQFSIKDCLEMKEKTFMQILQWIKESSGIYYAINNEGNRGMAYLEEPTKKQAKYQRQKNSKRIVFLNFKDWKEYIVNENELK